MIVDKIVTQCFRSCPFFEAGMDFMACGHPYFNDKNPHDGLIITQNNSRNRVPDECPLREHPVTTRIKLK